MKASACILAIVLLAFSAAFARADEETALGRSTATLNAQGQTARGQQRVLGRISKQTGVPVSTLQTQKTQTGFGNGELLIANSLASASGKSFDEIASLRASGEGWGQIANSLGVKLGSIVSAAHRATQATQHSRSASASSRGSGKGSRSAGVSSRGSGRSAGKSARSSGLSSRSAGNGTGKSSRSSSLSSLGSSRSSHAFGSASGFGGGHGFGSGFGGMHGGGHGR